ncbi:MAG TPA: hypothetical protein VLT59_09860, partial [Steroidobacteraceae bacterium]|nr:hypothetical protein [Steroidobacteraceae bacterium]
MRPANLIKIVATVCCGWLVASAASGAGVPGVRILAYEPLELRSTTGALGSRKSGASHAQEFEFDAYGRRFAGELTRNHRLDAWSSAEATAYRGTLAGQPGSWVRLTHSGEVLHGMIWDGRELYVIAPGADSADALVPPLERPDGSIIFRLADTRIESPAGSCVLAVADDSHFEPGDAVYTELIEDLSLAAPGAQKPGAVREISVSLLADSRFLRYAGSAAHASDEILARL